MGGRVGMSAAAKGIHWTYHHVCVERRYRLINGCCEPHAQLDGNYESIDEAIADAIDWVLLTWTPETEPALMRASQPARLGQEKPHETQASHSRADHSQAAHR